jgi:crotonobetaine/carnitine-CoA ligase
VDYQYLKQFRREEVTMVHFLEWRAAADPEGVFFTWDDEVHTFADFNTSANRTARNLANVGIQQRTRVLVLMDTSPDYLRLWFALAKAGAVEVPVNTAYHGEILLHQLSLSAAEVAIVDEAYAEVLLKLLDRAPTLRAVVVRGRLPKGTATGLGLHAFSVLDVDNDTANLDHRFAYDSVACIIFTSGTTGPSKGVILTHHYLAAYGLMYAETNRLESSDVLMNFLPFFHIGAKFLTAAALAVAGRMHLQARLSVSTFWDQVRRYGVTNFIAVGGICNMLLSRPPKAGDAESSLRVVYAVPDPAPVHEEFERRFGCRLTSAFGSTEIGFPIMKFPEDPFLPGAAGRPSDYYEVRIFDEHDNELPAGAVGEIVVRPKGPYLVGSGYVGMPERTVAAWRNLWMHTGDRGRMNEDGWLWFEDRASDSIRRRGENISSFEIEMLVCRHPAVAEAAAVAVPAEVGEDEVRLLVVTRQGHELSHEQILEHCIEVMPYFMVPRYLDIVAGFPRTPTAKVEKYKIREAGLVEGTWDREVHGWVVRHQQLVKNRLACPGHGINTAVDKQR